MKAVYLMGFMTLAWLTLTVPAQAFGLSPSSLRGENLLPGSHFEQEINISGTDSNSDSVVKVKFNVPEANDWIKIDRGNEFKFSAENKNEKILIRVDVPQNASVGRYKGSLNLEMIPESPENNNGQVSINYGGQIDVDLNVVSNEIKSFSLKSLKIADLETGKNFWFFDLPGIIRAKLQLENTGNVSVAPDKMVLKIFNAEQNQLLETLTGSEIEEVKPFTTAWVEINFKTQLPAGSYWANYEIYQDEKIVKADKIHLSIMEAGVINDYTGANFWEADWQDLTLAGLIVIAVLGVLIWGIISLVVFLRD